MSLIIIIISVSFHHLILHHLESWVGSRDVLHDGEEEWTDVGDNRNLHSSRQRWRDEAKKRGETEEEEEAAICLSQASGALSQRRPAHIPAFQGLSVSSSSSLCCTIFFPCLHFCQLVPLCTSPNIIFFCFLRWNSGRKDNFFNWVWWKCHRVTITFGALVTF